MERENSYHHMTCFVIENLKGEITVFQPPVHSHQITIPPRSTIDRCRSLLHILSSLIIFIFTIISSLLLHEYSYLKIFNSNYRLHDVYLDHLPHSPHHISSFGCFCAARMSSSCCQVWNTTSTPQIHLLTFRTVLKAIQLM